MNTEWRIKEGVQLNIDDVIKMASSLKSLAVYLAIAASDDNNIIEINELATEGLQAIDRIFDY